MKKITKDRVKLFDGFENNLFDKDYKIDVEDKYIEFIADDVIPNKLTIIDIKDKKIKDLEYKNIKEFCMSKENLPIYYLQKQNYIIIFSLGEYQPTRYIFYLEGIWKY